MERRKSGQSARLAGPCPGAGGADYLYCFFGKRGSYFITSSSGLSRTPRSDGGEEPPLAASLNSAMLRAEHRIS